MEGREPLPQITLSGSLIALAILFLYAVGLLPLPTFELKEIYNFITAVILFSVVLGTIISQVTIIVWQIRKGFSSIDYSKKLTKELCNEDIKKEKKITKPEKIQIVFDRYVHSKEFPPPALEYARRRLAVYWLSLVTIWTSVIIIASSLILLICNSDKYGLIIKTNCFCFFNEQKIVPLIFFWGTFGLIGIFSYFHLKKVENELYYIEKHFLEDKLFNMKKDVINFKED